MISGHVQCSALWKIEIFWVYHQGIQSSREVKLQPVDLKKKMESRLNVCLHLKTALYASAKAKRVDKDGEVVLAHCDKNSKDSVELVGLCKLFIFYLRGSHVCGLSSYRDIAQDIGSTDCEDQEKQFLLQKVTSWSCYGFTLKCNSFIHLKRFSS